MFPDTDVRRGAEPPDLRLRSLAACRYVEGRGVLSGQSAALLLGADCAAPDAPAEVTVPGGGRREHPGLRVHRGALPRAEIVPCRGALVTSPVRTAYDLGRQPDLVGAVVGIDALAYARRFDPAEVLTLARLHPGGRGSRGLRRAVALSDPRAGPPMETRLRLILVLRVLPRPEAQFPVLDDRRRRAVRLDLAYPAQRIGIEYEGADHGRPERVLLDAGRYTRLVDAGWRIYRFTKYQVYGEPDEIAATIGRALCAS